MELLSDKATHPRHQHIHPVLQNCFFSEILQPLSSTDADQSETLEPARDICSRRQCLDGGMRRRLILVYLRRHECHDVIHLRGTLWGNAVSIQGL